MVNLIRKFTHTTCPTCGGQKTVWIERPKSLRADIGRCPHCQGTGSVRLRLRYTWPFGLQVVRILCGLTVVYLAAWLGYEGAERKWKPLVRRCDAELQEITAKKVNRMLRR